MFLSLFIKNGKEILVKRLKMMEANYNLYKPLKTDHYVNAFTDLANSIINIYLFSLSIYIYEYLYTIHIIYIYMNIKYIILTNI